MLQAGVHRMLGRRVSSSGSCSLQPLGALFATSCFLKQGVAFLRHSAFLSRTVSVLCRFCEDARPCFFPLPIVLYSLLAGWSSGSSPGSYPGGRVVRVPLPRPRVTLALAFHGASACRSLSRALSMCAPATNGEHSGRVGVPRSWRLPNALHAFARLARGMKPGPSHVPAGLTGSCVA